jgi:hypothetical protein
MHTQNTMSMVRKHKVCRQKVRSPLTQHVALLSNVTLEALGLSQKSGGHVKGTVTLGFVKLGFMFVQLGTATCG